MNIVDEVLMQHKLKKAVKWIILFIIVIYAVILLSMAFGWGLKYYVFLQQQSRLNEAVANGLDYEALKRSVSYLQASAQRKLNNILDLSLYFSFSSVALTLVYKKLHGILDD